MRLALGVSYRGAAYQGWQSQPGGQTVQETKQNAAVLDERIPSAFWKELKDRKLLHAGAPTPA